MKSLLWHLTLLDVVKSLLWHLTFLDDEKSLLWHDPLNSGQLLTYTSTFLAFSVSEFSSSTLRDEAIFFLLTSDDESSGTLLVHVSVVVFEIQRELFDSKGMSLSCIKIRESLWVIL